MNELERMKQLAGLLLEDTVNFSPDTTMPGYASAGVDKPNLDTRPFKPADQDKDRGYEPMDPKDLTKAEKRAPSAAASNPASATFTEEPTPSGAKFSIATRAPEGSDVNDPNTKKSLFLQALASNPVSLLQELNARLDASENSMAVSDRLSNIIDSVNKAGGNILNIDQSDKNFVLLLTQNAIENLNLVRVEEPEYNPEDELEESDDGINQLRKLAGLTESDANRPYVCVHTKKGKCEVTASSTYDAVKKAADKWKLKSTAGIDAYLADVTHTAESAKTKE
jgi:hypothetical protein